MYASQGFQRNHAALRAGRGLFSFWWTAKTAPPDRQECLPRAPTAKSGPVNDCSKSLEWYSWKHTLKSVSTCRSSTRQSFLSSSPNCMAFDSGKVQWLYQLVCKFQQESLWNHVCVCTLPRCDTTAVGQITGSLVCCLGCSMLVKEKSSHDQLHDQSPDSKRLQMKPNKPLHWKELLAQLSSQFLIT